MFTPLEVAERLRTLPLPLDPASVQVQVVKCSYCSNGRGDSVAEDPDDFGIPSCCNGYGLRLDISPGMEPLILLLAAFEYDSWEDVNRASRSRRSAERLDLTYAVEEAVVRDLDQWPAHEHGARVSSSWGGSEEQALDRAIAEGRA